MSGYGEARISFTAPEAAHIFRDLKSVGGDHGRRNVSRETHDRIMKDLSYFLEVHFRGEKSFTQQPLFPTDPSDGLGPSEHQ